jgi:hypothetical protein
MARAIEASVKGRERVIQTYPSDQSQDSLACSLAWPRKLTGFGSKVRRFVTFAAVRAPEYGFKISTRRRAGGLDHIQQVAKRHVGGFSAVMAASLAARHDWPKLALESRAFSHARHRVSNSVGCKNRILLMLGRIDENEPPRSHLKLVSCPIVLNESSTGAEGFSVDNPMNQR